MTLAPRGDDRADRREANRAIAVSALGLTATGVVELILALVTGSVVLLADALHNLSNVATSAIVFVGFRISRRPPTPAYPYGYERTEDLAGLGVALLIWASGALAGYESWRKLTDERPTTLVMLGIAGAVFGVVGNQLVARYKLRVGRRIHSAALIADAKHSWLDALSSLGALVGLGLVGLGFGWGDAVAGLAVTLFILHVGWEVTRDLARHLMDGVDPEDLRSMVRGDLFCARRWRSKDCAKSSTLCGAMGLSISAKPDTSGACAVAETCGERALCSPTPSWSQVL